MSCWVAPSLAAEMWGMALDQVMERIRSGEIEAKHEHGFTFVDVAPYSKRVERPKLPPGERPATFTVISDEELAALGCDEAVEEDVDENVAEEEESAAGSLGDWRAARKSTSRGRLAPLRKSA